MAQFIADVTPLDTQIAELNRTKSQDKALRQSLAAQRQELVKGRVVALRDGLSALGTAQLDIHIEQMKAKIKIVPAPDLSE